MNLYDTDLINFMNTLILSELTDYERLDQKIEEKGASTWNYENLWRLVELELSLNPDVNAHKLGLQISSSCKGQESLRSKLSNQVTSKKMKYFEKPRVVPEEFLKILWSWEKNEYEFTVEQVRNDYKNGLLLEVEARNFELEKHLIDEVECISELLSEECSGAVWFGITEDYISLHMGLNKESFNNETFEIAAYDCSTRFALTFGNYYSRSDKIILNARRIAALAGILQGLLNKYGPPPNLQPELSEYLVPLPASIKPQDIQFLTLLHELGHRNSTSFKEYFGLRNITFNGKLLILEELIADLYAINMLRSHPERNRLIRLFVLYRFYEIGWFEVDPNSTDRLIPNPRICKDYKNSRNILSQIIVSTDSEAEISEFFTLLANLIENKGSLSSLADQFHSRIR